MLYLEMLLGGRRGRQYVFRWIYAGWLLLQFFFLYLVYLSSGVAFGPGAGARTSAGEFGSSYLSLFVVQQQILILLATPVFVAGAITDEKSRGTLQYLLTADLTPAEIVTGKLLGRAGQVLFLAMTGLPLLCFVGVFGGLNPLLLLVTLAITVVPVFAVGAASVLASVWSRETRTAVLRLFAVGGAAYLLWWAARRTCQALTAGVARGGPGLPGAIDSLLSCLSPLYVLEPAWGTGDLAEVGGRLLVFTLAWGGVGVACVALAVWRLRPAYVRQLEAVGKKRRHWWQAGRRPVGDDPIRWMEQEVHGIAPLAALRVIPRWLGIVLIAALTVASCLVILWVNLASSVTPGEVLGMLARLDFRGLADVAGGVSGADDYFMIQGIVVMLLASLVVGIRCSGAVSGEREHQAWEALLLTPLETRQVIRGKLWGIIGAALPYLAAYAVPALLLSPLGGGLAFLWTALWLAVTALAMYYLGAAGLWCSVKSKTSWRSLLGTLGLGYLFGFIVYAATSPLILFLAVMILLCLVLVDNLLHTSTASGAASFFGNFWLAYQGASCAALAGIFFGMARYFIHDAEKWVGSLERTRHWGRESESVYRTRRRRAPRTPRRSK